MWDHLATTYGAPTAVSAYTDFLRLMKLRINPSDDLGSKLAEFNMVLGVLATQQLAIAEPLQCMILCGVFSDKWGQGPINILSSVQAKDLKINDIIARLKELSSHHTGQSNLPKLESRIQATSSEPDSLPKVMDHLEEEVRIMGECLISPSSPSNNNNSNSNLHVEKAELVVVVVEDMEYDQEYDQQYDDQEGSGQYDDQYDEGYESYSVEVTALDINTANCFEEFEEKEVTPVPVQSPEPVAYVVNLPQPQKVDPVFPFPVEFKLWRGPTSDGHLLNQMASAIMEPPTPVLELIDLRVPKRFSGGWIQAFRERNCYHTIIQALRLLGIDAVE
ncbi:hypothetical protein PISMIDRAFT_20132 [Pisolithus microcarpus 441]|uniref:Unplaced genomic scaffold scaffold_760, whole genome shotgun sequence n=1 Tax=Pisolithus microcarpus 441 TaxID=765257 RepID=A0A0C9Y9N3_9AGAM|nr:hypothetical protein PISMIDRAFT_20132 [Pisolithus microcarpus 441]